MESSLKNMILSLFGVTFIASTCVALVYTVTKEPIQAAEQAAIELSLTNVLPSFETNIKSSLMVDDLPIDVYTASKGNKVVGYAVKSSSKAGYSGMITLMVGISTDDKLLNVSVLSHKETPGLGSKMADEGNSLIKSVKGASLSKIDLRVKKDGGDVDALSGATISSRAYGDAIERAYTALQTVKKHGNE